MGAYLDVAATLESDHYQSEALLHLAMKDLSDDDLLRVIRAVGAMESDHYKAALLVELANQYRTHEGVLFDAMVDARHGV